MPTVRGEALTLPSEGLIGVDGAGRSGRDPASRGPSGVGSALPMIWLALKPCLFRGDPSPDQGVRRLKSVSLALIAPAIRHAALPWPKTSSTPPTI
jgi:hypothetical protein